MDESSTHGSYGYRSSEHKSRIVYVIGSTQCREPDECLRSVNRCGRKTSAGGC